VPCRDAPMPRSAWMRESGRTTLLPPLPPGEGRVRWYRVGCACAPISIIPSPLRERARERVKVYRLRRCLNCNDAAGRAAAGYLSLLVQRKVTQRKHAPKPPKTPALLAEGGARQTAHPCAAGEFALPARTALRAAIPAFGCDARRRLRVPTSKATTVTENWDIVCVGWVRCIAP
jgi:hypothetical protein